MNAAEKLAFLKGLLEGLELDQNDRNVKVFGAIVGVLEEVVAELEEVADDTAELMELVDEVDEDLGELEEVMLDFLDDEDAALLDDCCGGHHHHHHEEPIYEVICPSCGEEIYLDEEMMEIGELNCPSCGELLEFSLDDETEEETPAE